MPTHTPTSLAFSVPPHMLTWSSLYQHTLNLVFSVPAQTLVWSSLYHTHQLGLLCTDTLLLGLLCATRIHPQQLRQLISTTRYCYSSVSPHDCLSTRQYLHNTTVSPHYPQPVHTLLTSPQTVHKRHCCPPQLPLCLSPWSRSTTILSLSPPLQTLHSTLP